MRFRVTFYDDDDRPCCYMQAEAEDKTRAFADTLRRLRRLAPGLPYAYAEAHVVKLSPCSDQPHRPDPPRVAPSRR